MHYLINNAGYGYMVPLLDAEMAAVRDNFEVNVFGLLAVTQAFFPLLRRAQGVVVKLPLAGNPRAKMQGIHDGLVKLFCRTGSGTVIGGVVVAPRASELIFPVTLAVEHRLTVDDVAHAFTVYPSLSGSIAEAARRLHRKA